MDSYSSTIKTCSICNTTFACSPTDCWCSAMPAIMPLDAGGDCYCPACLKALIEKKQEQVL